MKRALAWVALIVAAIALGPVWVIAIALASVAFLAWVALKGVADTVKEDDSTQAEEREALTRSLEPTQEEGDLCLHCGEKEVYAHCGPDGDIIYLRCDFCDTRADEPVSREKIEELVRQLKTIVEAKQVDDQ